MSPVPPSDKAASPEEPSEDEEDETVTPADLSLATVVPATFKTEIASCLLELSRDV